MLFSITKDIVVSDFGAFTRGINEGGQYDRMVWLSHKQGNMNASRHTTPVITVKEARKLLGSAAVHLTDGELELMLFQQEQLLRFIFRQYVVHKDAMVQ